MPPIFPDCGSFRILARKELDSGRKIQEILTGVPVRGSPDGGGNLPTYCGGGAGTGNQLSAYPLVLRVTRCETAAEGR